MTCRPPTAPYAEAVHGDLLDVVLLVACVVFGISGYRQGFVVGVLSFAGFLGGGAVGAKLAPAIAHRYFPGTNAALVGLVVVFLAAALGQVLAIAIGTVLRTRLTWRPLRLVDSVAGASVSIVSVLLVAWLLATAVAHSSLAGLGREVRESQVLAAIDGVMPDAARVWFSSFRRLLDNYPFPQVFGSLQPERVVPVAPPDPKVLDSAGLRAAQRDVVKITGDAKACSRRLEGSGFVYAPQRVMTNAHVVAGVQAPVVRVADRGAVLPARVVVYDARRDVAVLYVPGLSLRPLSFAGRAERGSDAVVAGYPQDGPFTATPARVRSAQQARGPDIYQQEQVTREVYSLRAVVRPGNSGGPLLSPAGGVYGVVFAAAVDRPDTGYALTAREVASDAAAGTGATRAVSTRGCD